MIRTKPIVIPHQLPRFGAGAAGVLVVVATGWLASAQAQTQAVIVGGERGEVWRREGASCDRCKKIDAIVIRGAHSVEQTNAPGGVIDFGVADRANWIFPQRADTTQNIMLALEARGGSMTTPTFGFRDLEKSFSLMIDDDGDTALEVRADEPGQSANAFGMILQFDLGAIFGINRIKFFPRNADSDYPAPRYPVSEGLPQGVRDLRQRRSAGERTRQHPPFPESRWGIRAPERGRGRRPENRAAVRPSSEAKIALQYRLRDRRIPDLRPRLCARGQVRLEHLRF